MYPLVMFIYWPFYALRLTNGSIFNMNDNIFNIVDNQHVLPR